MSVEGGKELGKEAVVIIGFGKDEQQQRRGEGWNLEWRPFGSSLRTCATLKAMFELSLQKKFCFGSISTMEKFIVNYVRIFI